MTIFTQQMIDDAARCANFMQKFKMLIWEKWEENKESGGYYLNEVELDEMAMELYEYVSHL